MPGVVFLVCVPTANYQQVLEYGRARFPDNGDSNLLCLEVQLRDKNPERIPMTLNQAYANHAFNGRCSVQGNNFTGSEGRNNLDEHSVPMEKVLDELLRKLEVEHVVWCGDKAGNYYEVMFPVAAGDPCENMLHCLTELGVGKKLNSVVSVLPCSVVYSGLQTEAEKEEILLRNAEEHKQWKSFVESVRSKLTVKQVVDGVRSGGQMSFDYLLLIVTADSLAALGLVENNSPNIVAAMLVSPLMGPVMSITFGVIIADRQLQLAGLLSLVVGMLLSCLFGFIFGLILGTTEMPWGFGDWPTEEMKSRGNVRALWMGVLWALTSGSGVAVALLQGSAGPLIGVAISASLLPPVVNCGLYWALACIWLIYKPIKIPHLQGEPYYGNSSYQPLYSDYLPIEFAINGIVSACLTVINVICIFITAIMVLKIKEVAAPYTSSPDLRRFWQQDLRLARETNRNTNQGDHPHTDGMEELGSDNNLTEKLEEAVREAMDDDTFRKVQRVSYQTHGLEDVGRQFLSASPHSRSPSSKASPSPSVDLAALDRLVSSLLAGPPAPREATSSLGGKVRPQRSLRSHRGSTSSGLALPTIMERGRTRDSQTSDGERTSSWSEKMLSPMVSHALQNLRLSQHNTSSGQADPLLHKERDTQL